MYRFPFENGKGVRIPSEPRIRLEAEILSVMARRVQAGKRPVDLYSAI